MPLIATAIRWYDTGVRLLERLDFVPPLIARLTIGAVFIPSGWGKLHHLDKVVDFFTELGIPAPQFQAPFAAGSELLFGVTVLLGLFTRMSAIPLAIIMVVAMATAKREDLLGTIAEPNNAWGFANALVGLSEYLYVVLLLWLLVRGAGALSLDRLLVCKRGGGAKSTA
jgi:putative oxidoreductase